MAYTDFAREAVRVQQHLQKLASAVVLAASAVVMLALTTGAGVAGAATRSRSGAVHAELASHVSGAATTANASSSLTLTGPTVMASVVALMAFSAFAFIVVTLIRRRSTAA